MIDKIIGIDPGKKGAICVIKGREIIFHKKTPLIGTRAYDLNEMRNFLEPFKDNSIAYIEKVNAMPGQGVTSMFTFGMGYGYWIGLLTGLRIPSNTVTPKTWKAKVLQGTKKDKVAAIEKAKMMFPDINLKPGRAIKDDDNLAEAALIAVYGGTQEWITKG